MNDTKKKIVNDLLGNLETNLAAWRQSDMNHSAKLANLKSALNALNQIVSELDGDISQSQRQS